MFYNHFFSAECIFVVVVVVVVNVIINCGQPEEPAILISTLLLQTVTHARQLCSSDLTRFLLSS